MAKTFGELQVYQKARAVNSMIWALRSQIKSESSGTWYQLDKSAGSVADNIAEGFGRETRADFKNFLRYSRGSAMEAQSQVQRSFDRNLITQREHDQIIDELSQVTVMIKRFQEYLAKSSPPEQPNVVREPFTDGYSPESSEDQRPHWWHEARE